MFVTFTKSQIISVIMIIVLFTISIFSLQLFSTTHVGNTPNDVTCIVIDAGHGGIDGGCIGASGTEEAEINLEYAKCLKNFCEQFGFRVVMTRTNDKGLYSIFSENKKKDDMKNRKKIIQESGADIVVSVHMNSFSAESSRGAQVFFNNENENSLILAQSIQKQYVVGLNNAKQQSKNGNYYIIKCTNIPSVLLECGFLSNLDEEKLLLTKEYKEKLCYLTLCGIIDYFGVK